MSNSSFTSLKLEEDFLKNLDSLGYKEMTSIQKNSLPYVLENRDIVAKAKTGSGKTVSFGIGVINKLNIEKFSIQALILAPTRELANQIAVEIRRVGRFRANMKVLTLCGGVPYKPQVNSLRHGAHVVVGTPGRILKHLRENTLNLKGVDSFVLDEADRMLDMGFSEDILKIEESLNRQRQSMLFSATYKDDVYELIKRVVKDDFKEIIDESCEEKINISQEFYEIALDKFEMLKAVLSSKKSESILIFCNTKVSCDELADRLFESGADVLTLHSDLEQKERDEVLTLFSNKSYPILIATDLAARGLDIDDVELIINYDLAFNKETHTHRIGRTARAGKSGVSVSFYNEDDEAFEEIKESFLDIEYKDSKVLEDSFCESIEIDSFYRTLYINGGKKDKLRAGDIVGALVVAIGLDKDDIGDITTFPTHTYVAIKKEKLKKAKDGLNKKRIKNRFYRVFDR